MAVSNDFNLVNNSAISFKPKQISTSDELPTPDTVKVDKPDGFESSKTDGNIGKDYSQHQIPQHEQSELINSYLSAQEKFYLSFNTMPDDAEGGIFIPGEGIQYYKNDTEKAELEEIKSQKMRSLLGAAMSFSDPNSVMKMLENTLPPGKKLSTQDKNMIANVIESSADNLSTDTIHSFKTELGGAPGLGAAIQEREELNKKTADLLYQAKNTALEGGEWLNRTRTPRQPGGEEEIVTLEQELHEITQRYTDDHGKLSSLFASTSGAGIKYFQQEIKALMDKYGQSVNLTSAYSPDI